MRINNSRFDILFLGFISAAFFLLMTFDVNSWYYSAIGDEYDVFNFGKDIVNNKISISLLPSSNTKSIFEQNGVYNHIPIASTVVQALPMKLLGISHASWIIGSIFVVIASFWLFYFLAKDLFNREVAIVSSFIFISSHYIWGMVHTGYWNIQILVPSMAAFFFFLRGMRQKKEFYFFLSGIFSGLGFYTYYSARIPVLFLTIFVLINLKSFLNKKRQLVFFGVGFLMLFLPFFYVNGALVAKQMFVQSVIKSTEIPQDQKFFFFLKNLTDSFVAFYKNNCTHHYVSGSLTDLITASFFTLGLILAIFNWRKLYFLLLWLLLLLIVLGGFSPYTTVPITRLFFLLPVIALLSGYAIIRVTNLIRQKISYNLSFLILIMLLGGVFCLNIYRFYKETPSRIDLTSEAVTIGALVTTPSCRLKANIFVFSQYYEGFLETAIDSYNLNKSIKYIKNIREAEELSLDDACIIFSKPQEPQIALLIQRLSQNEELVRNDFFSPSRNTYAVIFLRKT